MSRENRKTIAIAWYKSREDYELSRVVMDDGDVLPDGYEVWLRRVEAIIRIEESRDSVVLKAMIIPELFVAWCRATNQRPNVDARDRHVRLAIEDYCSGNSNPTLVVAAYQPA